MDCINNTLFIGKVFHFFEQLPSTNLAAADYLLKHKNTEGVAFCTFNQIAGRGQMGNRWESAPNQNIALSIILKPHFLQAREQFALNKAIALAVYDCIAQNTEGVSVKWANDIFIGDKKTSGILIQNNLSGNRIDTSIIGIGVNVNQVHFQGLPFATSLKSETGKDFNLSQLVETLCQYVEKRYFQLKSGHHTDLHSEYLSKLYRFGEESLYQYPSGDYFQGKIIDVAETGKLMVLTKNGVETFDIKEIKFVI